MRTKTIIFLSLIALCSCKDGVFSNDEPPTYIEQWTGDYDGESDYSWSQGLNSYNTEKRTVKVTIAKGKSGSTLSMQIIYNDQILDAHTEIHVPASGSHQEQTGRGSSLGGVDFNSTKLGIETKKDTSFHPTLWRNMEPSFALAYSITSIQFLPEKKLLRWRKI